MAARLDGGCPRQDLWMCLICGHVGCGRYREGHAAGHSKESGHAYALELEAQRVWDYSSDNYVHRLVQSKTHGKLVELPSPAPSSSERHAEQQCGTPPAVQPVRRTFMGSPAAMLSPP